MDKVQEFSIERNIHANDKDKSEPYGIFHGDVKQDRQGNYFLEYYGHSGLISGEPGNLFFQASHNLNTTDFNIAVGRAMVFDPFTDPNSVTPLMDFHLGDPLATASSEPTDSAPAPSPADRANRRRARLRANVLQVLDEMYPDQAGDRDAEARLDRLNYWMEAEFEGRLRALDSPEAAEYHRLMMVKRWDADGVVRTGYQASVHHRIQMLKLQLDTAKIMSSSFLGGASATAASWITDDQNVINAVGHQGQAIEGTIGGKNTAAQKFTRNVKPQVGAPKSQMMINGLPVTTVKPSTRAQKTKAQVEVTKVNIRTRWTRIKKFFGKKFRIKKPPGPALQEVKLPRNGAVVSDVFILKDAVENRGGKKLYRAFVIVKMRDEKGDTVMQGFYQSTGVNSGKPGQWLPFDGQFFFPRRGYQWIHKKRFENADPELNRYGTQAIKDVATGLDKLDIDTSAKANKALGQHAVNALLDMYGAIKIPPKHRLSDDGDYKPPIAPEGLDELISKGVVESAE